MQAQLKKGISKNLNYDKDRIICVKKVNPIFKKAK